MERIRGMAPAYLFFSLPVAAAFMLTQLPTSEANRKMPLVSPAQFLTITFLVCALTLLVAALSARRLDHRMHRPLLLPAVFLLAVGEGLFLHYLGNGFTPGWLSWLACTMIGLGGALMMLLWGRAFSQLDSGSQLITLSLSFVLAGAVAVVLRQLPWQYEATAEAVALVLIAALPLEHILADHRGGDKDAAVAPSTMYEDPQGTDRGGTHADVPADGLTAGGAFRRFLSITWRPFCGALLCLIIVACRWGTSLGTPGFDGMEGYYQWQMSGFALGGAIIFIAALLLRRRLSAIDRILRYLAVVAAALLLVAWFLVLMDGTSFATWSSAITGGATALLCITAWCAIAEFSHVEGYPARWFGTSGSIMFVCMVAFATVAYHLVDSAEFIVPVLVVAYLVVANFEFGSGEGRHGAGQPADVAPIAASPAEEAQALDRLASLAATYRLSPRESEVLPLLARGHSASYIADELCVSLNTVKTHTRRIYDKMGVHTRDELISLIGR